jgi:hypothetical protein
MERAQSPGTIPLRVISHKAHAVPSIKNQKLTRQSCSLLEAKSILGLEKMDIDVYVRQNPVPNAYTMAMQVM